MPAGGKARGAEARTVRGLCPRGNDRNESLRQQTNVARRDSPGTGTGYPRNTLPPVLLGWDVASPARNRPGRSPGTDTAVKLLTAHNPYFAPVPYHRLIEVTRLQNLALIKLILDGADIPYRVLYEHSLHVGSYLLGGSRGAVVEVAPDQHARATELLAAEGFQPDHPHPPRAFGRLHEFELLTESLPGIGGWSVTARLLVVALGLALAVALLLYAALVASR